MEHPRGVPQQLSDPTRYHHARIAALPRMISYAHTATQSDGKTTASIP